MTHTTSPDPEIAEPTPAAQQLAAELAALSRRLTAATAADLPTGVRLRHTLADLGTVVTDLAAALTNLAPADNELGALRMTDAAGAARTAATDLSRAREALRD